MLLLLIYLVLVSFDFVGQKGFHLFVVVKLVIDVGFILFVVKVCIKILDMFGWVSIEVYLVVSK
jgi:hypothetical protein